MNKLLLIFGMCSLLLLTGCTFSHHIYMSEMDYNSINNTCLQQHVTGIGNAYACYKCANGSSLIENELGKDTWVCVG